MGTILEISFHRRGWITGSSAVVGEVVKCGLTAEEGEVASKVKSGSG